MAEKNQIPLVSVFIMGKEYKVPSGLTLMKAMEYAGYRYTRGAGCRAGFCGACATIYRLKDDYKLKSALACQTTVDDGMYLVQLPFTPANKKKYDMEKLNIAHNALLKEYPEIARCISCNSCTKVCPQELKVMDYVQASLRGDIEKAAILSFDCVQCGLCAFRCPAEITQYHVGQLARRLNGKFVTPKAIHTEEAVAKLNSGVTKEEIKKLKVMKLAEIKELYKKRSME